MPPIFIHMKIRVEIEEEEMKTKLEFEGELCKERMIDFIESLDFPSKKDEIPEEELSIRERLTSFLMYDYPKVWFTSMDAKNEYERIFDEKIKLSTVSTYLSRMHRDGILSRKGSRVQREYKLVEA